MRISLLLLGLLWLGVPCAFAQSVTVPPEIELTLDKSSYDRLEPVLLTITLTNPSGEPQGYGPPQPQGYVTYSLTGPGGEELDLYALFHESVTVITAEPYAPGESRSATVNLLDFFPASIFPGTHTLVTRFMDPFDVINGVSSEASAAYEVLPEPSSPDADSLAQVLLDVRDLQAWTIFAVKDTEQTLERLLDQGSDLPPHADELALFLYALYSDVDGMIGRAPGAVEVARQRYGDFLARYPESPYALQARYGHLAVFYEEEELESLGLTTLPSAATLASPSVDASFSGNSFLVSGLDHDLSGNTTGSGEDRHGIAVADEAGRQSVLDALSSNQEANITGQDPAPDVAVAAPGLDVEALVDLLLARADLITLDADPGNQTVGTATEPVVAYAPDGLDVQGSFEGFGILVVEGTFEEATELRGNASWTGLVIVRAPAGAQAAFDMSGSVEVIGAVVLQSDTGAVLDVGGSSSIRYSAEALGLAQSLLDAP